MAYDVYTRFKSFLPGGGYDSSGRPVQGKSNFRGVIKVTSYTRGGETLRPQDLGLEAIDDLTLTLVEPLTGPNPSQQARSVRYATGSQQFYVSRDAENVEVTGAAAFDIYFDAFGDAAHNAEML
jgi:hypothetical protein